MLVKFGSIIVDGSGTLGGDVIQGGKAGKIMRTKVTPIQPINAYTIAAKQYFSTCQQKWSSFSNNIVQEWNYYATQYKYVNAFGDSKYLSGQQLFMKCCLNLFMSNIPIYEHAPLIPTPGVNIVQAFPSVTSAEIVLDFKNLPANNNLLRIKATPPLRPQINFYTNRLSLLYNQQPLTTNIDITDIYSNRYRIPVIGEKIYFEWQVIDILSGIESPILNQVFQITT